MSLFVATANKVDSSVKTVSHPEARHEAPRLLVVAKVTSPPTIVFEVRRRSAYLCSLCCLVASQRWCRLITRL